MYHQASGAFFIHRCKGTLTDSFHPSQFFGDLFVGMRNQEAFRELLALVSHAPARAAKWDSVRAEATTTTVLAGARVSELPLGSRGGLEKGRRTLAATVSSVVGEGVLKSEPTCL